MPKTKTPLHVNKIHHVIDKNLSWNWCFLHSHMWNLHLFAKPDSYWESCCSLQHPWPSSGWPNWWRWSTVRLSWSGHEGVSQSIFISSQWRMEVNYFRMKCRILFLKQKFCSFLASFRPAWGWPPRRKWKRSTRKNWPIFCICLLTLVWHRKILYRFPSQICISSFQNDEICKPFFLPAHYSSAVL